MQLSDNSRLRAKRTARYLPWICFPSIFFHLSTFFQNYSKWTVEPKYMSSFDSDFFSILDVLITYWLFIGCDLRQLVVIFVWLFSLLIGKYIEIKYLMCFSSILTEDWFGNIDHLNIGNVLALIRVDFCWFFPDLIISCQLEMSKYDIWFIFINTEGSSIDLKLLIIHWKCNSSDYIWVLLSLSLIFSLSTTYEVLLLTKIWLELLIIPHLLITYIDHILAIYIQGSFPYQWWYAIQCFSTGSLFTTI